MEQSGIYYTVTDSLLEFYHKIASFAETVPNIHTLQFGVICILSNLFDGGIIVQCVKGPKMNF